MVDRKMVLDEFLKGEEMRGNEVWGAKTNCVLSIESRVSVSL